MLVTLSVTSWIWSLKLPCPIAKGKMKESLFSCSVCKFIVALEDVCIFSDIYTHEPAEVESLYLHFHSRFFFLLVPHKFIVRDLHMPHYCFPLKTQISPR
ncbi:hypothetical protein ILYODFUR_022867 [Ilyodon furcidens]|uniref:Secreted protein n=1 Tax=Ilyodon furcidens TaxID=33524 RepID=A0ABV0TL36_9TELE